jgi:hypothetical protein
MGSTLDPPSTIASSVSSTTHNGESEGFSQPSFSCDDTAAVSEPTEYESVDPRGDLYLIVGLERKVFRVCSRTLARASPVFARMLYGEPRFKEYRPNSGPWIVPVPDDDVKAMRDVLMVLHLQSVVYKRSLSQAHAVLVVTNKYDCTASVYVHIQHWLPTLSFKASFTTDIGLREKLGIAWETGNCVGFKVALQRILETSTRYDHDSTYVRVKSKVISSPLIPESVCGKCTRPFVHILYSSFNKSLLRYHP